MREFFYKGACALLVVQTTYAANALGGYAQSGALGSGAIPQQVSRDGAGSRRTGAVTGRVVAKDTGLPIAQAEVRAMLGGIARPHQTAVTDDDGRFELVGLADGRYTIVVAKQGYVGSPYVRGEGVEATAVLGAGSNRVTANFALPRAGVLAGLVTDERGNPAVRVSVTAMRYEIVQGHRRLVSTNSGVLTDDRGEVRVYGLPPGRYFVLATPFAGIRGAREVEKRSVGYAATFSPSSLTVQQAQAYDVGLAETTPFQIALQTAPLATVDGVVVDAAGTPRAGGLVTATLVNSGNAVPARSTPVSPDGSFTLTRVPPGTYLLSNRLPAADRAQGPTVARATVTVAGEDVSGVVLETLSKAAVSGRVILPPSLANGALKGIMSVSAIPVTEASAGPQRPGRVESDGRFAFEGWPGLNLIRVAVPSGIIVKSIRVAGQDVIDTGVELPAGGSVPDVEIEVSNRVSGVTGIATGLDGAARLDYGVIAFAQDPSRWDLPSGRHISATTSDQTGKFVIRSLPPGKYYIVAIPSLSGVDWADPSVLRNLVSRSTSCSVREGETLSISLVMKSLR